MTIRAVAVDLGGVLFEDGTRAVIEALIARYPAERCAVRDIYTGPLSWELRCGRIESQRYWQMIAQRYGETRLVQKEDLRLAWYDSYEMRRPVLDALIGLSLRHFVGAVSVNVADRIEFLERKYRFRSAFAFEVYSFDVGVTKREAALYLALQRTVAQQGLRNQEVLMIDDHQDCLDQAASLGFLTALAATTESFYRVLDGHGLR